MADQILSTGQSVPETWRFKYADLGSGVYALIQAARLVGPNGPLDVDGITDSLVSIDIVHREAHEGDLFSVSYKTADGAPLADNATIILAIRSPGHYLHFQAFGACGGDAEMEFYSGSTIAADGTVMTPNNHNIAIGATATAVVRRDPTVGAAGTLRDNFLIPGGTGGNAIGGDGDQRDEWIMPPGMWSFVRLTNRAGNAQPASLKCVWYEKSTN